MSCRGDSDDDSSSKRRVAYVYSPEYIETCDTLSKVPNRVSWIERYSVYWFITCVLYLDTFNKWFLFFIAQASMVHSLIEAYGLLEHLRWAVVVILFFSANSYIKLHFTTSEVDFCIWMFPTEMYQST